MLAFNNFRAKYGAKIFKNSGSDDTSGKLTQSNDSVTLVALMLDSQLF